MRREVFKASIQIANCMFLYLSKLAPLFVYPLGFALILLGAALILRRRVAWRTTCEILALLLLLIFSNRWVAHRLAQSLEGQYAAPDIWPEAAMVIVLGGATRAQESPRAMTEVNEAGDRLLFAARLYQMGVAEHLLVTGGNIEWLGSSVSEAGGMRELLMLMGVPEAAVLVEDQARNTYENATYSRGLLESRGFAHVAGAGEASEGAGDEVVPVVLVTSAMHMPRSVAIFEKQGFKVIPAPVDYVVTRGDPALSRRPGFGEWFLHLLPSVDNLEVSTRVIRERIGLLVYGLRGWL